MPFLLCVQFLTVVELTNGNQKFSRKLQQKNNGRYCGSWAKYCNIMSTPETLQILFISTLSYPRLRSSVTGYNYYLLFGGTNLFGTSSRCSSWSAFGQSTGNNVSGHYKQHYFLLVFSQFPPLSTFLIEGVLGSRNLFCKS